MSTITRAVATAAAAALAATAQAQPAPADFSGQWELNISKSNFGGVTVPPKMTATIAQTPTSLTLTQTATTPAGEQTVTQLFHLGAKDSTYAGSEGLAITTSAAWEGATLVLNLKYQRQGVDFRQINRWALSPDGKMLMMAQDTGAMSRAVRVILVYDRK